MVFIEGIIEYPIGSMIPQKLRKEVVDMKVNTFSVGTEATRQTCSCICYTTAGNASGASTGSKSGTCGKTCQSGNVANSSANFNLAYSAIH